MTTPSTPYDESLRAHAVVVAIGIALALVTVIAVAAAVLSHQSSSTTRQPQVWPSRTHIGTYGPAR